MDALSGPPSVALPPPPLAARAGSGAGRVTSEGIEDMTHFKTIAAVKEANRALEHHWFDRDTLRFFDGKVLGGLISGRYFVSSEQRHAPFCDKRHGGRPLEPIEAAGPIGSGCDSRRYTIREANDDGSIDTVGEFQAYATAKAAQAEARAL